MNLLPKSHQEFGQSEYWNTFFKKRGKKAFEWYGEYPELCDQIHKYIKPKDKTLNVGCGNSKLSMDLYDVGYKDIVNIDISKIVIKQMQDTNRKQRPDMKFIQMDATQMDFNDEEFSVVLDKGTLDALMTDDSQEVREICEKYCREILRVLRNGGRYVCISLLQEHILRYILNFFPEKNCMIRIVRCFEAEQKTTEISEDGTVMPVFVFVATKFNNLPMKVLEVCLDSEKMQRLQSVEEVITQILSVHQTAMVCNGLNRSNIAGLEEISIDLYQPGTEKPRYTVRILDQTPVRGNGKYAAFIVPQGREVEWLFSTPQGRKKLLSSAHHDRLAIVSMHRDQNYSSWADVKAELSNSIRSFAPRGIKEQIPYLSLGDDVGHREIIHRGTSEFSGDFVIEEIEGHNGNTFRRLIFLSNDFVIQSEALMKKLNKKKNSPKKYVDIGYLACQHHLFMTIGTHFSMQFAKSAKCEVLVVGLGGGGLCTFIHQALKNIQLTAIEIDPVMLEVAEKFFDLKQDERFEVIIEDGLKYLQETSESKKHFNAILFDVDSKDSSVGMSCPPKAFIELETLTYVKSLIGDDGIFILNLVCRDEKLREDVVKNLNKVFTSICCYKLDEYLNEIIYCRNNNDLKDLTDWKVALEDSSKNLNETIKKLKMSKDDMVDIEDFLKDLKIQEKK